MTINIDREDAENLDVDRDGTGNGHGAQGFNVWIGGVIIHFEDERDAEVLARRICRRQGIELMPEGGPVQFNVGDVQPTPMISLAGGANFGELR